MQESTTILELLKSLLQEDFLNKAFLLSFAGGIVTAFIMYGRKVVTFIYDRILRKIRFYVRIEQIDELFWQTEAWLFVHHQRKYRNVIAYLEANKQEQVMNFLYGKEPCPVDDEVTEGSCDGMKPARNIIKYRQEQDTIIIFYKGAFIKINKGRDKLENASNLQNAFFDSFHISTLFGTNSIKSLLKEITVYADSIRPDDDNTRHMHIFDGWNWNRRKKSFGKTIDRVIIDKPDKALLVTDIDRFLSNQQWYYDRSIPYKRGYLFYGPPGNGKTSLAIAVSNYTKRDLFVMNLGELKDDKELIKAFADLKEDCILLIEDIDVVFKTSREMDNEKLNFSTLLNCMDGVYYREGIITVMTTNHIEKLDPALIRAGRMDLAIKLPNPREDIAKEYINLFFNQNIALNGELSESKLSMAEIQNICLASTPETIIKSLT